MRKLALALATTLVLGMGAVACSKGTTTVQPSDLAQTTKVTEPEEAEKALIYTSIYPVYEFTKKLAGEGADVKLLVPPGTEAHDWEPSPQDLVELSKAKALIVSGAGMEEWADDLYEALKQDNPTLRVHSLAEGLELLKAEAHEHEDESENTIEEHKEDEHHHHHGEFDPHIWLSPKNMVQALPSLAKVLTDLLPQEKEQVEERLMAELKQLEDLDQLYRSSLAEHKGRKLIVAHDAYGYLCRDYGLEQYGIEGLLSESEPSPKHLADLIDLARAEKLHTIFVEPLSSPKAAETVASAIGGKTAILDPYEGPQSAEQMDQQGYHQVMKQNLKALEASFAPKP